jgi:hypothetical protein
MPRTRHSSAVALTFLAAALLCHRSAAGQEIRYATTPTNTLPPPSALAEPLRPQLFAESVVIERGESRIHFWGVRSLALSAGDKPEWAGVAPGALVGALQTEAPLPDIRGFTIPAGVYTLRFAMQPQDGDHMGVSPYRQFLVVSPAAEDRTADALGFDGTVALGKKTLRRSHPATLSIDPPVASTDPGSVIKTDDGHTAVVFSVPCTRDGQPVGALSFGLILVGRIDH